MKTLDQLREYYESNLRRHLAAFEKERGSLKTQALVVIGILGVAVFAMLLFSIQRGLKPQVFIAGVILCFIIWGLYYRFAVQGYRSRFKAFIMTRLIRFLESGLEYRPHHGISRQAFMACGLFMHRIDQYKCEDMIQGQIGKTQIMFSEVHAQYKVRSGKHTHWHTIFKGIFFIADFNKNFHGRTVVLPDAAEKLFGLFGQTLQSWNSSYGQLVRLEDVQFEKEFVVYSTDQIEARYILSPALMERIVDYRRRLGTKLYLSFLGSKVFGGITVEKDLFEPSVFSSVLDFNVIAEYYAQLQLGISVVDELNLNTRIWTKE